MPTYCPAVDGLYLRAAGSFVCWNSPGEMTPLERLAGDRLDGVDVVRGVLNGETFWRMRRVLHQEREPFSFCQSCSWGCAQGDEQWQRVDRETYELRSVRVLQVEPSFLCNLDCPECFPIGDLVRHRVKVQSVQYGVFALRVPDDPVRAAGAPLRVRHGWTLGSE